MKKKGSVVQLDRISDFGSEGWGFESSLGHAVGELIHRNWSSFFMFEIFFDKIRIESKIAFTFGVRTRSFDLF